MSNNIKISVKTFSNQILTFTVDEYQILDGTVSFTDKRSNLKKTFPISSCEITETIGEE